MLEGLLKKYLNNMSKDQKMAYLQVLETVARGEPLKGDQFKDVGNIKKDESVDKMIELLKTDLNIS